jgi:hypothetical protein
VYTGAIPKVQNGYPGHTFTPSRWWMNRLEYRLRIALFAALLASERLPARAAQFNVKSDDDIVGDRTTQDNICDTRDNRFVNPPVAASNICTLRAAIEQANATPGKDRISVMVQTILNVTFNVSAAQPPTLGHLVTPSAPARQGDVIVLYASGLGLVDPAVDDGAAPGASPTTNQVQVQIGNLPAKVQYAGLSPGSAGLYQVNTVVPAGVTPGSDVRLTLSVAGQTSPPFKISIQ